jgi:flagellar assembly protein FliH
MESPLEQRPGVSNRGTVLTAEAANVVGETMAFTDFEAEAQAIIEQANDRARTIVTEATDFLKQIRAMSQERDRLKAEVAEIRVRTQKAREFADGFAKGEEEGKRAGHEEGFEEGRDQGRKEVREETWDAAMVEAREQMQADYGDAVAMVESIHGSFEQEKQVHLRRSELVLVKLAVRVAELIVGRELRADELLAEGAVSDDEPTRPVVMGALHRAAELTVFGSKDVRVRAAPADVELIHRFVPRLDEFFRSGEAVSLVEDESIGRGGVVLNSSEGDLDIRIETQLVEIQRALLGETAGSDSGDMPPSREDEGAGDRA